MKQKFSQQALLANTEALYERLLTRRRLSLRRARVDQQQDLETVTST